MTNSRKSSFTIGKVFHSLWGFSFPDWATLWPFFNWTQWRRCRVCLGILLNPTNWILARNNSFLGCVSYYWWSGQLSFCSSRLSSWVYKFLHVTSIPHFAVPCGILDDNCISIFLHESIWCRFKCWWQLIFSVWSSRIRSPPVTSLVGACLLESAYSSCLNFLLAYLSLRRICHSASVAWWRGGITFGNLSLSFLPIRSSAGYNEVTVWGVLSHWKRKFLFSYFWPLWATTSKCPFFGSSSKSTAISPHGPWGSGGDLVGSGFGLGPTCWHG